MLNTQPFLDVPFVLRLSTDDSGIILCQWKIQESINAVIINLHVVLMHMVNACSMLNLSSMCLRDRVNESNHGVGLII